MKASEIIFGLIKIPLDFALIVAAFALAYNLRLVSDLIPFFDIAVSPSEFPPFENYLQTAIVFSTILMVIFIFANFYSLKKPRKISKEIWNVFVYATIWLLAMIAYYFVIRDFPFSRLALLQTWLSIIFLVSIGKIATHKIQQKLYHLGFDKSPVLIIGESQKIPDFAQNFFQNPQFALCGYLANQNQKFSKIKYLGKIEQIEQIIKKYKIEKIIEFAGGHSQNTQKNIDLITFCRAHQLEYSFIPEQIAIQSRNIEIDLINDIPILHLKPTPLEGWGRVLKRIFDFIAAILLLIVLAPLMAIIAILIKIDDRKGTILFKYLDDGSRVKRVGQKGVLFKFYKFRSMKPNTHNLRYKELADLNLRKNSPLVKIKNDPRVTKIGKFLRKTSLDELPQLFNVIKGEMSLVGPRPHLPEEVATYADHQKFVLTIKPGITGLAQTNGRSDLNFDQEIKLDTYYIENWSFWLDLKILFNTVFVVFQKYDE